MPFIFKVSPINKYTPTNIFIRIYFSSKLKLWGFYNFYCIIVQWKRILLGIICYQIIHNWKSITKNRNIQESKNKYTPTKEIISNQYLMWPSLFIHIFIAACNLDDIELSRFLQSLDFFYLDNIQLFNSRL